MTFFIFWHNAGRQIVALNATRYSSVGCKHAILEEDLALIC